MLSKHQLLSLLFSLLILLSDVSPQGPVPQTFKFTTQVTRLMDILINSLYSQKQIFLREVISNASDALDKIRFLALTDENVLGNTKDLEIRIQVDQKQKYIQIRDTGIGMTRQEMIENLGTIAKSGTTNYLEALKAGNINLIGQFGVGFYSTFLVGSKVVVISKSNSDDTQWIWTSEAAASYQIKPDPQGNTLGRGSIVRIYLKEDSQQYLNQKKLLKLVKKYSQFIDFPIFIKNKKEIEEEVPVEVEQKVEDEDIQIKQTEQQQKAKTDKVKKTVYEWQQINTEKALWLRDKDDIYEQDYIQFFKSLSKQSNPPMNWIHFNTDGEVVFNSIIYIPNRAPSDFYANYHSRKNDIKLYVRRVLITQQHTQLIPKYLSFVMGVIDSDDLPLNVNRQTLQQSKTFKIINQKITRKILDMIQEVAKWDFVDQDQYEEDFQYQFGEEQIQAFTEQQLKQKKQQARVKYLNRNKQRYQKFYKQFGKAIKLGILQDKTNRPKLSALSRWHSTHSSNLTSFDEYISRMKKVQDQIYFFSGEDRSVLEKSPLVVGLVRRGYEVILCDDPIDQYVFSTLRDYQGKNIVNVGKGDFKMPDDDQIQRKKLKFLTKKYEPLVEYTKKLLFEKVANVIISNRLTDEPCVVVADSYGHSSFMDKIQKAQMFAGAQQNPTSQFKKIMQINPHHKVNQLILQKINKNQVDSQLEQLLELMYQTAAFHSGFSAKDPNDFVKRFYKTYSKALGVLSLQRQEVPLEDVELDQADYQGDNEEVLRVSPQDVKVSRAEDQDIV